MIIIISIRLNAINNASTRFFYCLARARARARTSAVHQAVGFFLYIIVFAATAIIAPFLYIQYTCMYINYIREYPYAAP